MFSCDFRVLNVILRVLEQSRRLEMIGIELNQGIGRLKITFGKLAAGEKYVRRRREKPNIFSRDKLAVVRFMLFAGELVPKCPYNNPRGARCGEILRQF